MRQELRVFVLGDMSPRGRYPSENRSYVIRTNTSQIAQTIDGAAAELAALGEIPSPDAIVVTAPEDSERGQIVEAVLAEIERSDLIIVDISTESPSTMYELAAVNALGTPYILVTDKTKLPFYLVQTRAIFEFKYADAYSAEEDSHRLLRKRLLANYKSADGVGFTESCLSNYFSGIPIVNISGPAGIATGYHMNTLYRFGAQSSGFLQKPVKIARDGQDVATISEISLTALVVVMPDLISQTSFDQARSDLESGLGKIGLGTMSASILEKDDSGQYNRFGFGAMMLADHPGIVIDIPRTIYPLSNVPRIKTATQQEGALEGRAGRKRLLRRLVREFRAILDWNVAAEMERNDGGWRRIHFVNASDAPAFIAELATQNEQGAE